MRTPLPLPARVGVVAGGLALALSLGAALAALQLTLPKASAPDRLAAQALRSLEHADIVASVERLGNDAPLRAHCAPLKQDATSITFSNGERLLISDGTVRKSSLRVPAAARRAVIQLAGCRDLLAGRFAARIVNATLPQPRRELFRGKRAYGFVIDQTGGATELIVQRQTLTPLAIRFRSKQLRGWGYLVVLHRPSVSSGKIAQPPLDEPIRRRPTR